MTDLFVSIKAQLDIINGRFEDRDKGAFRLAKALQEIQNIPNDDVGNGLQLAKRISEDALRHYADFG